MNYLLPVDLNCAVALDFLKVQGFHLSRMLGLISTNLGRNIRGR